MMVMHAAAMLFMLDLHNLFIPRWIMNGSFALDIFFFLSGYFCSTFAVESDSEEDAVSVSMRPRLVAVAKRFIRLATLHTVIVGFCLVATPAPNKEYAWYALLFMHNWAPFQKTFCTWTWSVTVDFQLHVLAAVLPSPSRSAMRFFLTLGAMAVTCLLYTCLCFRDMVFRSVGLRFPLRLFDINFLDTPYPPEEAAFHDVAYMSLPCRAIPFFVGICVAACMQRRRMVPSTLSSGAVVLVLLFLLLSLSAAFLPKVATSYTYPDAAYSAIGSYVFGSSVRFTWSVAIAMIAILMLRFSTMLEEFCNTFVSSKLLHRISASSYVIFLIHPLVIGGMYEGLAAAGMATVIAERFTWTLFTAFLTMTWFVTALISIKIHEAFEEPLVRRLLGKLPRSTQHSKSSTKVL
jgi:peptidoglycan/LPS O-acetylase OafA/YrhL